MEKAGQIEPETAKRLRMGVEGKLPDVRISLRDLKDLETGLRSGKWTQLTPLQKFLPAKR